MNVKNKFILIALAILNCTIVYSQQTNILLIIADDVGVDAFNGYNVGGVNPTTPHLDSIRNSGITFLNTWSSSVCAPTRAGIMSGMYGSLNGVKTVPGNLDTTYTSLLKALKNSNQNYTAGVTGKWHISHPVNILHPTWHGADHYMGVMEGGVSTYDNWTKTENNTTSNSTAYVTSYFTDDAINWIGNQNNPWFLWLAHVAPHTPLHIPPAHMYTQPSTNSQLKKFMAMIESLDYEVGRLLDSLTPAQKANTTIIFIGDNGTADNLLQDYPANHGKKTLYQGGIHVPMFVSGYGVSRVGQSESALINVIDIHATILELTGSNLPGGIYNSLSFKHLLTSSTSLPKRQFNFSELDTNQAGISLQGYAIRDSVYKLIEYHTGQQEMFNLITDPLETNDLLLGSLTQEEQTLKTELENEAIQRKTAWSCKDDIQNGDEQGIDCGGTYCAPCAASISQTNIGNNVSVFPNPATSLITIEFNLPKEYNSNKLIISSLDGKNKAEIILNNESSSITINTTNYKSGVYFYRIITSSGISETKKIAIIK